MVNGILVAAIDSRSPEQKRIDAINEVEEITGFYRKDPYKANAINIQFEIKLKNLGLKSRDGYDIYREFLNENEEKPIANVQERLDILIEEKLYGTNFGICPECGEKIYKNAKFCTFCGEGIREKYQFS